MIVGERKPFEELQAMLSPHEKILIAGCGTCVSVCNTGGEKEVGILATQLRMADQKEGKSRVFEEITVQRQCEKEFLDPMAPSIEKVDAVLSLGCGAGVQLLASVYPDALILPGINTTFLAANIEPGVWAEYCHGCGDCVLHLTAGICPVARCSKGLVNGACGGTDNGMCEVDPKNIECGWFLIYERLKKTGRLELLRTMREPKKWSKGCGAGPRRLSREDMMSVE